MLLETQAYGTEHFDSVHYEIAPELGCGFQDMRQFGSGLGIVTSDCSLRNARQDVFPAKTTALSMALLLSGHLSMRFEPQGKTQWFFEGDVVTSRGQIGRMLVDTPGGVRIKSVMIDLPLHIAEAVGARTDRNKINVRRNALDVRGRYLAQSLLDINKSSTSERLKAEILALELVQHLIGDDDLEASSRSGRSQRRIYSLLDQACDILQKEKADPPTIVQLARRIGLNEFALKSEFRKRFDCTIAGYVRSLRMNEAKTFLEMGECSVQEAALRVGYTNPSHFAAVFRAVYGYNPSKLIQLQRTSD